ncbi:enoyl-CoA hydratase/isomerase family protein [Nocardia neocaledoniensis]|uniref:enoyl-CoA hydratase/isomerase family protein n=1 Tax=Nocardia neocaledoniensis TaxID=236511 RepID=UPI0024581103|nr:enoyl-CoA hydratase/isomerase family protein [Nocardia neocaledoniensis]
MTADVVTVDVDGVVGYITLNRPDAMNAITVELGRKLELALLDLASKANVIVIRGAEGNFSVGGDFRELERLRAGGAAALRPLFENFARACSRIETIEIPVIAVVEGYAMAGGFELMLACDITLVRSDAKLADNHANFGQVPGGGSSQRLPRLAGRQRALGHILSGERMSGAQAEQWGLAYRSFTPRDFEDGVKAYIERIAGLDRLALAKSKRLVYAGLSMPLNNGIAMELTTVIDHVVGDSAGAGIATFTQTKGDAS